MKASRIRYNKFALILEIVEEYLNRYMPTAEYSFVTQVLERGVFSFCMCPGGEVINASSEEGGVCVNGMSYHKRDGENANSALLVSVEPSDFEGDDVLAGIEFQRKIERGSINAKIEFNLFKDLQFCLLARKKYFAKGRRCTTICKRVVYQSH
mgnify:CR=1 FL=1